VTARAALDALEARKADEVCLHGAAKGWTAADVLDAMEALSRHLVARRVLAVLADNSPQWAIADLACLKTGTTHLPLPPFFSASQVTHALNESGADLVLTDQPERIEALGLQFVREDAWNGLLLLRRAALRSDLPAGTAKLSFTSGSTGSPKGVCLSAGGLLDTARAVCSRLEGVPIQRHLAVLPLALLLENVAGIYAPLLRGAQIHLPGLQALGWRGMAGFEPSALCSAAASARANSMILVPELLKAWVAYLGGTHRVAHEELAFVAVGGAHVDAGLLARARFLGIPAYQGYGLTECGSVVCLNRPGEEGTGVGRPLQHADIRVVDGEVCVATRAFLGYLKDAPAQPEPPERREFATGDLGQVDARGHLHLSGRRKNLLITSFGRNVAPEWVESALLAQAPIAQAVVAGDARPSLCAILVPVPGAGISELEAAVSLANAKLPDYARIRHWLAAAPFTAENGQSTGNGRPIRSAILASYAGTIETLYRKDETTHAVL
jgi:long-chain acyl-CoA synthetase